MQKECNMSVSQIAVGYLQTNCYIVPCGAWKGIVIDPGGSYKKIDAKLQELGIKEVAVMLTHAHFDHILAAEELICNYSAKLYVHEEELDILNGDANLAVAMGLGRLPTLQPTVVLTEGEYDVFGKNVRVIHTPGHTKGSVCYVIDNMLFSGDTLFRESYGRTDFPTGSITALKRSVKKLCALPDCTVYPGHGESTSISYERENNPLIFHI